MSQPRSILVRFEERKDTLADIGYFIFGPYFVGDMSGHKIETEDVLVADWQSWLVILQEAKVNK